MEIYGSIQPILLHLLLQQFTHEFDAFLLRYLLGKQKLYTLERTLVAADLIFKPGKAVSAKDVAGPLPLSFSKFTFVKANLRNSGGKVGMAWLF